VPHFRLPAISHGVVSFIWGLFFGAFIWSGMLSVGVTGGTSFIFGAVAGFLIFLYVRVYGADEPHAPHVPQGDSRERAR
jgi:hypothetical protein